MPFTLATFNARDFFDVSPPGVIGELDRGAYGEAEQALADKLYARKLSAMALVLRRLDADIVALQEIKDERVLDDLRAALPPWRGVGNGGYAYIRAGVADRRGIACGILSRFPLVRAFDHVAEDLPFPTFVRGDPAPFAGRLYTHRGVLEVRVVLPEGGALDLFVVHLKSQRPSAQLDRDGAPVAAWDHSALAEADVRSAVARMAEALFVRRLVDARFDADEDALVAVAGDFNDGDRSVVVRTVAGDPIASRLFEPGERVGVAPDHRFEHRGLYRCARAIPREARHSLLYTDGPEQLDHVLVSRALWSRFIDARFLNEALREDTAAIAAAGGLAAESDHAALLTRFA